MAHLWTLAKRMILGALHAKEAIAAALYLEVRKQVFTAADDAAQAFGLRRLGDKWRGVDREMAARILYALLIEDMAYRSPRMSGEEARAACEEFLSQFDADSWFFTNGDWEEGWSPRDDKGVSYGPSWEPATNATFDGGIIVLGHDRSGVLWMEDED